MLLVLSFQVCGVDVGPDLELLAHEDRGIDLGIVTVAVGVFQCSLITHVTERDVVFRDVVTTFHTEEVVLQMAFLLGFGGYFIYSFVTGNPVIIFGNEIHLTVGELVRFAGYVDLIIWPMIALGQIISMRSRAKASLKRISEFLDAPLDVKNPENGYVLSDVKGRIEFRDFSFTYPIHAWR